MGENIKMKYIQAYVYNFILFKHCSHYVLCNWAFSESKTQLLGLESARQAIRVTFKLSGCFCPFYGYVYDILLVQFSVQPLLICFLSWPLGRQVHWLLF